MDKYKLCITSHLMNKFSIKYDIIYHLKRIKALFLCLFNKYVKTSDTHKIQWPPIVSDIWKIASNSFVILLKDNVFTIQQKN